MPDDTIRLTPTPQTPPPSPTLNANGFFSTQNMQKRSIFLLKAVAHGDEAEAIKLIKKNPDLLLQRSDVTDLSGRTFQDITAFEYAYWAQDVRYMIPAMFQAVFRSSLLPEQKKIIYNEVISQHRAFDEITYELNGIRHQERHYSFESYLQKLETFDRVQHQVTTPVRKKLWCEMVGEAQRMLPVHFVQHFCDPTITWPVSDKYEFQQPELTRTISFELGSDDSSDEEIEKSPSKTTSIHEWYELIGSIGLGKDHAMHRLCGPICLSYDGQEVILHLKNDISSLRLLHDKRKEDCEYLDKELSKLSFDDSKNNNHGEIGSVKY